VWQGFRYTVKAVYPDQAAIWRKLRYGSFSFNWIWWRRSANPELPLRNLDAGKPTAIEIDEFRQAWDSPRPA
jgi:hypothetical protein